MKNIKTIAWEKINETSFIDNKYLKAVTKRFKLSDGEERDYTVIKGRDNVIALCLTEDNKVIVLEQFRTGPEKVLIDLPSGGVDKGETPEQAAKRELEEETGYTTDDTKLIGQCYASPTREGIYYFVLAKNCKRISKPRESEKQLGDIMELTIEEFKEYLVNGNLTSADLSGGFLGLYFMEKEL